MHDGRVPAQDHADIARRRRSNHIAYSYGDVFERAAQTAADLRARIGPTRP